MIAIKIAIIAIWIAILRGSATDEESPPRGWSDGTKKRPFRKYSPVFPNPLGDPYGGAAHRHWVQCLRRDYGSTATVLYFP